MHTRKERITFDWTISTALAPRTSQWIVTWNSKIGHHGLALAMTIARTGKTLEFAALAAAEENATLKFFHTSRRDGNLDTQSIVIPYCRCTHTGNILHTTVVWEYFTERNTVLWATVGKRRRRRQEERRRRANTSKLLSFKLWVLSSKGGVIPSNCDWLHCEWSLTEKQHYLKASAYTNTNLFIASSRMRGTTCKP